MTLPKAHRLKHRHDFSSVYKAGLRRNSSHMTLRALKPKASSKDKQDGAIAPSKAQPTRIGISISQKVSKRAVVRNRIKRQIKSAFRHLLPQMHHGWQIVVVVRPDAVQCDYQQFLQELKQLLVDAEVIDGY